MQSFIIKITQENTTLLSDKKIGCFILPTSCMPQFAQTFIKAAHQNNKLVLAEGDNAADFHLKFNTDGLILNTITLEKPQQMIKKIKNELPKAILGVICRNRRHEAMLVSECEPDFVIFKFWHDGFAANKELISWYNDLFLIQNAAQIEEPCEYKTLPADFIILSDTQYQG